MKYTAPIIALFGLLGGVSATMSPANMQDTGLSLARQAFDVKDLVLQISSTMNSGPMQVSAGGEAGCRVGCRLPYARRLP